MARCCSLLVIIAIVFNHPSQAQMAGSDIFLKGRYLEIGQSDIGAFGSTVAPPAGFHSVAGGNLGAMYDYGRDGWAVGTPANFGDYILSGSGYEGWAIQAGGSGGLNWALSNSASVTGPGSLTGHNLSYAFGGDTVVANWAGSTAGGDLQLTMQTRIDTGTSWVVVTVKMYNMGIMPVSNIYYLRTIDPQNDYTYSGDSATDNIIPYQGDTFGHTMAVATGTMYSNALLGLATIDHRAKAFIYNGFPINSTVTDLANVWSGTAIGLGATFTDSLADNGQRGTGLVYNIGTMPAGDSASLSFAYIFSSVSDIDSACRPRTGLPTAVINNSTSGGTRIFPVPANSALTLANSKGISDVSVFGRSGRTVLSNKFNSTQVQVDVSTLPAGVYFIRINGAEVRRFVKE